MKVTFRRGRPTDIPALRQLSVAAETIDEGAGYTPAIDSASVEVAGLDLVGESWLAETQAGEVVGYTHLETVPETEAVNFWLRGTVNPAWRGRGIGRELMARSWADMEKQYTGHSERTAFVNTWAYQQDERRARLFARFGLHPYHIYHELAFPAVQVEVVPTLPAGALIRPWHDNYCEAAASLRNRAFAESWGYQDTTGRALRRCFITGRYEPNLSFTAWQTIGSGREQMVGLVHCCLEWTRKLRQANEGEIVWLAVAPEARGRGIATALLLTAMHALRQAGVETISVGADNPADSPALGIYTRLGFTVRKAVVDFRGEL